MYKRCSRCDNVKKRSEFNKNAVSKDGLNSHCRDCNKGLQTSYRAENLEQVRLGQRQSYGRNREGKLAYQRNYGQLNCDVLRVKARNRYRLNRERHMVHINRRRALVLNAPGSYTAADVVAKLELQGVPLLLLSV